MNSMRRHLLRLAGIAVVAIALPQLASASDDANGGAFRLAMGPTSAAPKNQGRPAMSEQPATKCDPAVATCRKPHHRSKHRHATRR